MKETLLTPFAKIATDIVLIVLLIGCYVTGETTRFEANWSIWLSSHAVVGALMCAAMGLHLWQHWRMIKAFTKKKIIARNVITFLCIILFCLLSASIVFMLWPTHSTLGIHHFVSIVFLKLVVIHVVVQFPTIMRLIGANRKNKAFALRNRSQADVHF